MKAVRIEGNGAVSVVDRDDPVPGPGEVLVRTAVSAICGSELKPYRGSGMESGNGGHEAAGTVEAVGPGVTDLAVGERVGVSSVVGCGRCGDCAKGRYTWCRERTGYGSMHSELFLAAARACQRLPDDVPWDVGALLTGDGFGVPYHTSTKIADPATRTVAVFGAGPIGLGSVMLQSYLGRRVIAVDVRRTRVGLALERGAAHAVDASEADPVERILEITGGSGADVCIEAAGRPETAKQCFAAARTAGTVVFNGEQPAVELSPSDDFIRRDITAVGSWFYHFSEFAAMLDLYRGGLRVSDLVTHRYSLGEADPAFKSFAAGETGKVLLVCGREG